MQMERKLNLKIKSAERESNVYTGIATSNDVDRLRERINLRGLRNLDEYLQNPILLYNHDPKSPIGVVESVNIKEDEIEVTFRLASTPLAQEVKTLIDDGVLRALSIGFISHRQRAEDGILIHDEWSWLETSVVSIPANPKALIRRDIDEVTLTKGTTPYMDWDLDMERSWDADASEKRWRKWCGIESNDDLQDPEKRRKYRGRFFWWDGEGTTFGGYKLPFVDIVDGKPKAIWRGVVAAMAALLGARGGVDIPDEDRKAVYNHICRYYEKAGKEPPEYHKAIELIEVVRQFVDAVRNKNR